MLADSAVSRIVCSDDGYDGGRIVPDVVVKTTYAVGSPG
jgi:hypothetical protein